MSTNTRRQALQAAGLTHPRPEAVTAPLFAAADPFFFALDKVQVKYEMLRAHFGDGDTVTAAAATHGYSRAEFYLVATAFDQAGMTGLLDERRGRKGPIKLTEEVHAFLDSLGPCSATQAAAAVADQFARRGLAGLIDWPDAEPVFTTLLIGAARAAWTPYADPRVTVLAATYRLLLDTGQHTSGQHTSGQRATSYPDTVLAAGQQTMSRLNARSRS